MACGVSRVAETLRLSLERALQLVRQRPAGSNPGEKSDRTQLPTGSNHPMQGLLPEYEINPATWFYLSSLLTIGIFFKFYRLASIRNLDLLGLIAMSPALLWISRGLAGGYELLFLLTLLFLVRTLFDPLLIRRPLLEPNLNASGLTFTAVALLIFQIGGLASERIPQLASVGVLQPEEAVRLKRPLLYRLGFLGATPAHAEAPSAADLAQEKGKETESASNPRSAVLLVRLAVVIVHLSIVLGLIYLGHVHFENIHTAVGMASLYLLLPYTVQMNPRLDHFLPGALLLWTLVAYRQPLLAGILLGTAGWVVGYPFFLIPLWTSFYFRRGLVRFLLGLALALPVVWLSVWMATVIARSAGVPDAGTTWQNFRQLVAWMTWKLPQADGFWAGRVQAFRIPVVATFIALAASYALWPTHKNLGTLMSCSATLILGVQLWHPYQGGLYLGWYLPLLIATIFRPNLEDRLAIAVVSESWLPPRTQIWLTAWLEDWGFWPLLRWWSQKRR